MTWEPFTLDEIVKVIDDACSRMSSDQLRLWKTIKIPLDKWQQHPWGDQGNGFWVVAVIGRSVIWYNDIECGFNRSRYSSFGIILDYYCNQDELEWVVQGILNEIDGDCFAGGNFGAPDPVA